jgi:hypothetical protein
MKFIGALLFPVVVTLGVAHGDSSRGSVCFDRAENNGLMNSHLVRILAGQGDRTHEIARLAGGESFCVELESGTWWIEARSARPYDPSASDPDECRSRRLKVRVTSKERRIAVSPKSEGSAYVCGWDLR